MAAVYFVFKDNLKSFYSLKKVNGSKMYIMNYYGDYRLDDYLNGKPATTKFESFIINLLGSHVTGREADYDYACTSFFAENLYGEHIYGRNLDLSGDHQALLLYTDPPYGYSSVSMVDLSILGYAGNIDFGDNILDSTRKRMALIKAPYYPKDGMNEMGLAVSTLNVPNDDPLKPVTEGRIGRANVTRMLLDYAGNTEEAVELLKKYNIYFNSGVHYLISDSSGSSIIVEFVGGRMVVTESKEIFQVATNFIVYNWDGKSDDSGGYDRYFRAYSALNKRNGKVPEEAAMNILKDVSQYSTVWSVIYNLDTGDISICPMQDYKNIQRFNLEMESRH